MLGIWGRRRRVESHEGDTYRFKLYDQLALISLWIPGRKKAELTFLKAAILAPASIPAPPPLNAGVPCAIGILVRLALGPEPGSAISSTNGRKGR